MIEAQGEAKEFRLKNMANRTTTTDVDEEVAQCDEFNETASPCALEQVLQAMLPEDQALLVPHFIFGFSKLEIGRAIGRDKSTVRWRIDRAIRRTRERLGLEGELS